MTWLFIWHRGVFDSENPPMRLIKAEARLDKAQSYADFLWKMLAKL